MELKRGSVPTYALYKKEGVSPELLPSLLSPKIIEKALNRRL